MRKLNIILTTLLFALIVSGCSVGQQEEILSPSEELPKLEDTPQAVSGTQMAVIRWDGVTYEYQMQTLLKDEQIGEKLGEIQFKIEGSEEGFSRTLQDGDAMFLNAGTEVYQVKGENALAVKGDEGWQMYNAIQ